MFRLTREVRFAINASAGSDDNERQVAGKPSNSYGGFPTVTGLAHYFTLRATIAGELEPQTSYLLNIKEVDRRVRASAIPQVARTVRAGALTPHLLVDLFATLRDGWPNQAALEALELSLTPLLSLRALSSELPMVRLSQKFEFSATHRLYNPRFSEEQNRAAFGKCNNPHGHGHNYEIQVTLSGPPDAELLTNLPQFERTVATTVIDRFDHKNLNVEVSEFADLIPTVENIAKVIYTLLKPLFQEQKAKLASVTVWETPKTWCEYSE